MNNDIPRRPILKPIALILGGLVLGAALFQFFRPRAVTVETVVLARAPFEERLSAEGRLAARDKHTVVAFADGDLRRVTLRVGDRVRRGQEVARVRWDYEKSIKSPADGVVARIHRDAAGPIHRGDPLLDVADTNHLEVSADLLTSDAVRLRPGLALRVEGWGGPAPLAGRVTTVSRAGFTKISALGVEEERTEIRGELSNAPADVLSRLGDNYHVDVTVVVSTEGAGLSVPLGALFKAGDDWAVFRVESGRSRARRLQLGRGNDREALVLDGLAEGDRVILYPGDTLADGLRVRPAEKK